jgi:hypothetical protein
MTTKQTRETTLKDEPIETKDVGWKNPQKMVNRLTRKKIGFMGCRPKNIYGKNRIKIYTVM